MPFLPDIAVRRFQPELMDDPALDAAEHAAALRGLRFLNLASRTARTLWPPIHRLAAVPGHPPLRILDIATGSGDVPLRLSRLAAREGVPVAIDGCDISERAVSIARCRAAAHPVSGSESRFFRLHAIHHELPCDYDVVMCSLFMHHLEQPDAISLLYKMRSAARRLVLISDLRRTRTGLRMAWLASRLCRSRICRTDAVLSVRAAYTIDEFESMAHEAGLDGAAIRPVWPQRFLLTWSRG